MRALFDTGSKDIWVLSKKSEPNGAHNKFHYYFDDNLSKTAIRKPDMKSKITYGTGKVSGHFVNDEIRLGDTPPNFTEHPFGLS